MKKFEYIRLCVGYPKDDDTEKIIWRRWNGLKTGVFNTELFGHEKFLFAIDVSKKVYKDQFMRPDSVLTNILTLNLKREYWEQIRDGKKRFEYREFKSYWKKRLLIEQDK